MNELRETLRQGVVVLLYALVACTLLFYGCTGNRVSQAMVQWSLTLAPGHDSDDVAERFLSFAHQMGLQSMQRSRSDVWLLRDGDIAFTYKEKSEHFLIGVYPHPRTNATDNEQLCRALVQISRELGDLKWQFDNRCDVFHDPKPLVPPWNGPGS